MSICYPVSDYQRAMHTKIDSIPPNHNRKTVVYILCYENESAVSMIVSPIPEFGFDMTFSSRVFKNSILLE